MIQLKIIIGSTRTGRKGPSMAAWITDAAKREKEFAVELIDLAEVNLPMLDEPNHPRLKQYQHEHTKKWSAVIDSSDAFIIVTPEYNYSYPAALKNAIDFVFHEWSYKPAAFVSYGGIAAGTRSVEALKKVFSPMKMVPLPEAVHIPFFAKYIDENGIFHPTEEMEKSAVVMLKELLFWAQGLQAMRAGKK